ncbi:hypothetical protein ACE1GQ_000375 [Vibrio fluvialis]
MNKVKKIEIAKELLEAALFHYYETGSYFASIQCAGAAEEVLGKYVETYGGESAFESLNKGARRISRALNGQESSKKAISYIMNYAKNSTKHMSGSGDTTVYLDPKEAARDLIDRAVENYYYLMQYIELEETENVKRFKQELVA